MALIIFSAEASCGNDAIIKPPALQPGDLIQLIAPAGPASAREVAEAVQNLTRRGYVVQVSKNAQEKDGYLAGADELRASDLNQAFADPKVKMVLCLRGGFGSPRLLDRVDYEAIRRHPKIFVGYSDITALLVALRQKAKLVTFHGPMATTDFSGRSGLSPYAHRHFWSLLEAPAAGSPPDPQLFENWGQSGAPKTTALRTLAGGAAEGTLVGGNLSTLAALMGTPYEAETSGSILFLEDVNEEPFRIDRMLCQLRLAGKLKPVKGVLLGAFTRCEPKDKKDSQTVDQVLDHYFTGLGIPVLAGFPSGHLPEQATLPLGSRVRLDADKKTLAILEPAVAVASPPSPSAGAEGR